MRTDWLLGAAALLLAAGCGGEPPAPAAETSGAEPSEGTPVESADGRPLGTVRFGNSCDARAREALERGLALLHHMTYVEAEESFAAAAADDPECGLAYWGQAMTYVHPLWPDRLSRETEAAGRELLERAAAAAHLDERERAYVAALEGYYRDGTEAERLERFMEGWRAVHTTFPQDPEAKLFLALSTMATAPPSDKTFAKQRRAGALAEEVLAEIPNHPGAHHYVIHAYDVPPLAERALPAARNYGEVAPENSHALHMTSHIFTRRGLWEESIHFNTRAAAAAAQRMANGEIPMHHLHALDYLAYAHLQRADDSAAEVVLADMRALEPPFQQHAGTAYSFAAVPARLALERHDWQAGSAVEAERPAEIAWERFPHLTAISHFARGLGAARTGDRTRAEASLAELETLATAAGELGEVYDWQIQVDIQRLAVEAWLAYAEGEVEQGLELMRRAAEMEASTEKNAVTPGEVLPARELYGDMLLDAGRYGEARAEYEGALERSPNRYNSLLGAARAARRSGELEEAERLYRRLLEVTVEAADRPGLVEAHDFLAAPS